MLEPLLLEPLLLEPLLLEPLSLEPLLHFVPVAFWESSMDLMFGEHLIPFFVITIPFKFEAFFTDDPLLQFNWLKIESILIEFKQLFCVLFKF
ncbi:hypothetical protein DSECCO2_327380 [anaerobic digester metagenome]